MRSIRSSHRARGGAHARSRRGIGRKRQNASGKSRARRRRLQDHFGGTARRQLLGILALMVVSRGRQWNQQRRLTSRRQFRNGRGPGATDHEIRELQSMSHVVQERLHLRRQTSFGVPRLHHVQVALSGLMRYVQWDTGARQRGRCVHHRYVDRVRALRPSKDQHVNA